MGLPVVACTRAVSLCEPGEMALPLEGSRQCGDTLGALALVERGEVRKQHGHGPAVEHQVMAGDEQGVLGVGECAQACADNRAAFEIEALGAVLGA